MRHKVLFSTIMAVAAVSCLTSGALFSQNQGSQELFPQIKYSNDSMVGFDEAQTLKDYNRDIRHVTYSLYLSSMKKLYIARKYNIENPLIQRIIPDPASSLNTAFCTNSDFASGTFAGWTGCSGCNPTTGNVGYCTYTTPCGLPGFVTNLHTIMTGAGMDPSTNAFPVVCPGFTYSARLGTTLQTGHFTPDNIAEELDYKFTVPAVSGSVFTYNYAVVLESFHSLADAPYFEVGLYDASGVLVPCSYQKYVSCTDPTGCTIPGSVSSSNQSPIGNGADMVYKAWTTVSIDLSAYPSQALTARFIASDCDQGGHFGYAYIACSCSPFAIIQSVPQCGNQPTPLNAPAGFATYNWLPGGQTTSSIMAPDSGNYSVTMVAGTGCQSKLSFHVNKYPAPVAAFTMASALCSLSNVTFTDASTVAAPGILTNWHWDFGDGTFFNGQNPPPKTYASNTGKPVKLLITTSDGCTDTISKPFTGAPPSPAFSTIPVCLGDSNHFTNLTPVGTAASWSWNFGDPSSAVNNTSTLLNPTHIYPASGSYTVWLVATSSSGCKDTILHTVVVTSFPKADFVFPFAQCTATATVADASTPAGGIAFWFWNFEDGTTFNGQNPGSHTYATFGTDSIKLVVTMAGGCKDSITKIFNSGGISPVAAFSDNTVCLNTPSQFTDGSTITSGAVSGWVWNFGEPASGANNTSTVQNPMHTYSSAGTFTVSLTVTSAAGCPDSTLRTALVNADPANPVVQQNGGVLASSYSTGNQWNLNGNPISGATGQFYSPAQSGFYSVTVTGSNGCSATSSLITFTSTGIEAAGHSIRSVTIFPNPSGGALTIDFGGALTEPLRLTVNNTLGQVVFIATFAPGSKFEEMNMTEFISYGIYSFRFEGNSGTRVQRVVFSK